MNRPVKGNSVLRSNLNQWRSLSPLEGLRLDVKKPLKQLALVFVIK